MGAWLAGWLVGLAFRLLRWLGPDRAPALCGALMRRVGPLLPAHRIGRENLRAAFPDRDAAWVAATLSGAWDNLGRVAGEYVHLDRLWDLRPGQAGRRVEFADGGTLAALAARGGPVLAFAAHLGNWEMPGLIAPSFGIPSAMAYRMPNNRAVAAHILNLRRGLMGELIRGESRAGLAMRRALGEGKLLGMLIDQHFSRGVEIAFLGRACWANPTLARLARRFDCPVIGARVIRLPGGRFRVEVTPPLDLPRDGEGRIDVIGATQAMNDLISAWVREHPEQYLWFHRRWRIAQPRMAWAARRR